MDDRDLTEAEQLSMWGMYFDGRHIDVIARILTTSEQNIKRYIYPDKNKKDD